MINPSKVLKMARKCSFPRNNRDVDTNNCSTSMVADRGHFVVYTADQRRFAVPLVYLGNEIFRELLKMSEEEFGIPSEGPIVLPIDSFFMDYIIPFIRRGAAKDLQKALLLSVATSHCSSMSSFHQRQILMNQQLLVC